MALTVGGEGGGGVGQGIYEHAHRFNVFFEGLPYCQLLTVTCHMVTVNCQG